MRKIRNILKTIKKNIVSLLIIAFALSLMFILLSKVGIQFKMGLDEYKNQGGSQTYTLFDTAIRGISLVKGKEVSEEKEAKKSKEIVEKLSEIYNDKGQTYYRAHSNNKVYFYIFDSRVSEVTVKSNKKQMWKQDFGLFDKKYIIQPMDDTYKILLSKETYIDEFDNELEAYFIIMNSKDILQVYERIPFNNLGGRYYYLNNIIQNTIWDSEDIEGIERFKEAATNNMFYVSAESSTGLNRGALFRYITLLVFPIYLFFLSANFICLAILMYTLYHSLNKRFSLEVLFGANKKDLAREILPMALIVALGAWCLVFVKPSGISKKIALIATLVFILAVLIFISRLVKPKQLIKEIRNR